MRIFFDLVPTHTNAFGVHLSALLSDMRNLALALVIYNHLSDKNLSGEKQNFCQKQFITRHLFQSGISAV